MSWGKHTSSRVVAIVPLLVAVVAASLPVPPGPVQPTTWISAATGPTPVPTTAPGARTGRGLDEMGHVVMSGPSALVGGEASTAVGQLLAEDASCTAAARAGADRADARAQEHPRGPPGRRTPYVIMDNLSADEIAKIRTSAAKNRVELCLTPTYASWANPIEAQFRPLRSLA